MVSHADGMEGGVIYQVQLKVSLTNLHLNSGSLAIATAMEMDKKTTADFSTVSSARTAITPMILRDGSSIMIFYCCPTAIVLH